jgi:hypothetical protein
MGRDVRCTVDLQCQSMEACEDMSIYPCLNRIWPILQKSNLCMAASCLSASPCETRVHLVQSGWRGAPEWEEAAERLATVEWRVQESQGDRQRIFAVGAEAKSPLWAGAPRAQHLGANGPRRPGSSTGPGRRMAWP